MNHLHTRPYLSVDMFRSSVFSADSSFGAATGAEDVCWNLADLYPTFNDGAFVADMQASEANAKQFYEKWYGKIISCSSAHMREMIEELQAIYEVQGRMASRVS